MTKPFGMDSLWLNVQESFLHLLSSHTGKKGVVVMKFISPVFSEGEPLE